MSFEGALPTRITARSVFIDFDQPLFSTIHRSIILPCGLSAGVVET
jgi:hypothetical protein